MPLDTTMTVRAMRLRRQMQREELAFRARVSLGTIARIEAGQQVPSITVAQRIALALDARVDEIEWPKAAPKGERALRESRARAAIA
jgi:DNA-binding XRE family transcriptional regulator